MLYFTEGYYKESGAHCKLYHADGDHDGAIQSVVCRRNLTSKPLVLLFVQVFASNHCKHDMSALLWLNTETLDRAPTPLFGRLVKVLRPWALFRKTVVHKQP